MDQYPPATPTAHTVRWWSHLVVLTSYPLTLGILGYFTAGETEGPMLPATAGAVLMTVGVELLVFGVVFAMAVSISGARADKLLLRWREGIRPLWRGLFYSLFLRLVVMVAAMLIAVVVGFVSGGSASAVEHLRPEVENVVDAQALSDPLYFALTLTVVSFIVAGLREELWRAGMLAGMNALYPQLFHVAQGRWTAAALVAVVFGIGHLTQGLGGAIMTAGLGLGLGLIMMRHGSIWDAVFAHGFFNATTFAMLYWMARNHPEMLP